MADHDKIEYWKSRMQDNLHTFDVAFTDLQNDILQKSNHLGLDRTDLAKALNEIRNKMIALATAIQYAKPLPEPKVAGESKDDNKTIK